MWGQHLPLSEYASALAQTFCEQFGALATSDVIGNLHIENFVRSNWYGMVDRTKFESVMPDIIITMNANRLLNIKARFNNAPQTLTHWHVSPNGEVSDPLKRQTKIIECTPEYFFKRLVETGIHNTKNYYKEWKEVENEIFDENSLTHGFDYSAVSAIQALISNMQDGALFHISNSNNIRIANNFSIPKTVDVYCNRGTCGIDGSTSSYIAQSYISGVPSYMIVGDLSFFYDMNSIWNRYIGKARIMLINNSCGALFHSAYYEPFKGVRDVDVNVAAAHHATAKGWAESQGFNYLAVRSQTELEQTIKIFTDPNTQTPLFMEVFTDAETDVAQIKELGKCSLKGMSMVKNKLKEALPASVVSVLKNSKIVYEHFGFGGTGAMGAPLSKLLVASGNNVYVTSRSAHKSCERLHYLQGNAKDEIFLKACLSRMHYDAIVDFMSYSTNQFDRRARLLLQSTKQYIFISSARIFAESKVPLTENSPRLLETVQDLEYKKRMNMLWLKRAKKISFIRVVFKLYNSQTIRDI